MIEKEIAELFDNFKNGVIDDKTFFKTFANATVYYSTPFGDSRDGGSRPFIFKSPDNTGYLPVFISKESAMSFFESKGRINYMIMEGSFKSVMETTQKINGGAVPVKLGMLVEPELYGLSVNANIMDSVIAMCE